MSNPLENLVDLYLSHWESHYEKFGDLEQWPEYEAYVKDYLEIALKSFR